MNYVLKNNYYEATISTNGAEMISLKNKDGRELLWQNTTVPGCSSGSTAITSARATP